LGAIYNGEYNKAILHVVVFGAIIPGNRERPGRKPSGAIDFCPGDFRRFYMAIDAMRTAKAKSTGQPLADPFENWSGQRPLGPIILIGIGALFSTEQFRIF